MKFYDCSVPLTPSLVTWPGEEGLRKKLLSTIKKDGVEVSELTLGAHTGTHIDAPRHFIENGSGLHEIAIESLVGPATVVDLTDIDWSGHEGTKELTPEHFTNIPLGSIERILLKTQNSTRALLDQKEFVNDYVSISVETAKLFIRSGIKLVGTDFLSIEKKGSPGHPVHVTLLSAGVVNLEGVRLIDVPAGEYHLTALPLRIVDGDGSPARVILQTM